MSTTDYAVMIFGVYVLFELHRITDRLSRIAEAMEAVKLASSVAADNSAWLESMDQRLELVQSATESSESWLRDIVNPPEPKYREY